MTNLLRHSILPLLVVLLIGCPRATPTPDEPEQPEPPPIVEPEPPGPEQPVDPPEPPDPEVPVTLAPVPKPLGPPAEFGALDPWPGALEPVIDWDTCCRDPEGQGETPTRPQEPQPPPPGDDDPTDTEEVDETAVLGLQAVQHDPLTLAFVWAPPVKHDPDVAANRVLQYSGSISPKPPQTNRIFSQRPRRDRPSQSRRYSDLEPLVWYTFTVKAHFGDATIGTTSTIRAQAPAAPKPPEPPPPTCSAVNAKLRAGERVEYNGQCHDEDWTYYTQDARSKGYASVTVHPNEAGHYVCGHNNEAPTADGPNMLWCSVNAEWAKVGGSS